MGGVYDGKSSLSSVLIIQNEVGPTRVALDKVLWVDLPRKTLEGFFLYLMSREIALRTLEGVRCP